MARPQLRITSQTMFLVIVVLSISRTGAVNSSTCDDVRQVFIMKKIGSVQLVPESPVKGDQLELCPSGQSCCTPAMESKYRETVGKDLRNMLQAAGSYLKTVIASTAAKFRENFVEMIGSSENKTHLLFAEVYKKMEAGPTVSRLYSDLRSHVEGRDLDLESRLSAFFDSLFPLVYHHSINPNLKAFSQDYRQCLRETRHEIRPFGDVPERILHQLSSSFQSARTLLQSLGLAVEVLNSTEHADYGKECSRALVRLAYCPHCRGMVSVRPCTGYCLNVVRGCLAGAAELERPWADFLTALERLSNAVVGAYNIEDVLGSLEGKISEAIMHAMENGPELSKKVKIACGHPKRAARDVPQPLPTTATGSSSPPLSSSHGSSDSSSLYLRLQSFSRKLSEWKSFYGNLADSLCNDESLAAVKGQQECWNGHAIGEYTKTVAGVGLAAQKHNPEMRPQTTLDLPIATLVDKLMHVRQILNSQASAVPQSDSYVVEGSGSGSYWNNHVSDDEDYYDGSGSGDFQGGVKGKKLSDDDFDFTTDRKDSKNRQHGPKGSSGSRAHLAFIIPCVVLLLLLVKP